MSVEELIAVAKRFYQRNWVTATAGNFSAVVSQQPFELVITKTGVHRGNLTSSDFVHLDESGRAVDGSEPPAPETPIHRIIIVSTGARVVFQTHSVWSTVLADVYAPSGGLELKDFELLQNLSRAAGARGQSEWVPILESSNDHPSLVKTAGRLLNQHTHTHAILLRKHGLYTWGKTVEEAERHVEIFELLFEVIVRQLHIFSQADLKNAHRPS